MASSVTLCCVGHRWGEHALESARRIARSAPHASAATVSFAVVGVLPNAELVTGTAQLQPPPGEVPAASQSLVGVVTIKQQQPTLFATCWPQLPAHTVTQTASPSCPSSLWATFKAAKADTDASAMWGAWFNAPSDAPIAGVCGAPDDTLRLLVRMRDTQPFPPTTS